MYLLFDGLGPVEMGGASASFPMIDNLMVHPACPCGCIQPTSLSRVGWNGICRSLVIANLALISLELLHSSSHPGYFCSPIAMMTSSVAGKLDTVVKRLYTNGAPKVGGRGPKESYSRSMFKTSCIYDKGWFNEIFQYPVLACDLNISGKMMQKNHHPLWF